MLMCQFWDQSPTESDPLRTGTQAKPPVPRGSRASPKAKEAQEAPPGLGRKEHNGLRGGFEGLRDVGLDSS